MLKGIINYKNTRENIIFVGEKFAHIVQSIARHYIYNYLLISIYFITTLLMENFIPTVKIIVFCYHWLYDKSSSFYQFLS